MTRTLILIAALGALTALVALFWWAGSPPNPHDKMAWCGASGYFSKC